MILQPAGSGIGGFDQHEQAFTEIPRSLHKGFQCLGARKGIDGKAIDLQIAGAGLKIGAGIGLCGGANIATLGVENDGEATLAGVGNGTIEGCSA